MASDRLHGPVRTFVRDGGRRLRGSAPTLLQAIIAAVLAYAGATLLLGHDYPLLAPIAAWVLIGLSPATRLSKAAAMAGGSLIGVLLGETVKVTLGDGIWQLALFLLVAAFLARFLYKADIFTMQACIQGMVVMLLPPEASGGAGGRFSDAVMGLVVALIVVLVFTADPSSRQRRAAGALFGSMERTLAHLSLAARVGDQGVAESALTAIRKDSQQLTDAWESANNAADELSRYSPGGRRYKPKVEAVLTHTVGADRAMRETRVLARRISVLLRWGHGRTFTPLADALLAAEDAVRSLRADIADPKSTATSEGTIIALEDFASRLDPANLARPDGDQALREAMEFEGHAVVVLLRAMAVDLFEAVGLSYAQAQRALPGRPTTTSQMRIAPVVPTVTGSFVAEPSATTQAMRDLVSSIEAEGGEEQIAPWGPGDTDSPFEPWLPDPERPAEGQPDGDRRGRLPGDEGTSR